MMEDLQQQKGIKVSRNKYWSEKTDPERINFLMEELVRTQMQVERLGKSLSDLIAHKHLDGQVVKRIPNPQEESGGGFWFRVFEPR